MRPQTRAQRNSQRVPDSGRVVVSRAWDGDECRGTCLVPSVRLAREALLTVLHHHRRCRKIFRTADCPEVAKTTVVEHGCAHNKALRTEDAGLQPQASPCAAPFGTAVGGRSQCIEEVHISNPSRRLMLSSLMRRSINAIRLSRARVWKLLSTMSTTQDLQRPQASSWRRLSCNNASII